MNTKVITPEQCRAARAFLNWGQPDLASHAGITVNSISSFEKDAGSRPAARTMRRIVHAFDMAGIAFTETGVERRDNLVTVLTGENANTQLLGDIYETLKACGGGEVLIAGLKEPGPEDGALREFILGHIERLKEAGISERILTEPGCPNLIAPAHWYRAVPGEEFSATPFQLYGDKLALIHWGPPQEIVILRHPRFAATFRALFEQVWRIARPMEGAL